VIFPFAISTHKTSKDVISAIRIYPNAISDVAISTYAIYAYVISAYAISAYAISETVISGVAISMNENFLGVISAIFSRCLQMQCLCRLHQFYNIRPRSYLCGIPEGALHY
jgi:exosome complex RNA-binding protein Csl4